MPIKTLEMKRKEKKQEGEKKTVLSVPQQNVLADWPKDAEFEVVTKPHARLEGREKVTGRARYTYDVRLPGQLVAGVLRSPHPHAKVLRVDTSAAEALPGVHAVLSKNDDLGITWYKEKAPIFADTVRFVGDEVAAVAAESEEVLEDALRAIRVEYEVLPFVVDMTQALEQDAPKIHEKGNRVSEPETYERGDFEAGLLEADVTIDEVFTTQTALHNALEPHGTVAWWQGDELTVYDSTQGVFAVRKDLAEALDLPQNRVRVIKQHMGGGFGAKQVAWKQAVFAAMLSKKTSRPVQLMLDREGENLATGNRNPTHQRVRLGAKKDGTLTAVGVEAKMAVGAYSTAGEGSDVASLYQHLYKCDNVRTEQVRTYTNTGPAVAFRAPGYAEAAFALESAVDQLARELKMDPLELRRKNYAERDQKKDLPYSSPEGLRACYDRADETFGWSNYKKPPAEGSKRRGVGIAAHEWMAGKGSPPAYAFVKLNADGSADVVTGTQDIGTGSRTVLAQVAAEALCVPLSDIRLHLGDTANGPYSPTSAGSATLPTLGPAVRAAAEDAREQLLVAAASWLETEADCLFVKNGEVFYEGNTEPSCTVAEVTKHLAPHMIQGHGARHANPDDVSIHTFSVQCAEVEVDMSTGEVTLLRIVSAPDCGRVINPQTAYSQVIGGVTQGVGYALTEERVVDERLGLVLNADLEEYKIPTVADVPPIEHAEVNLPDLNANPTGAKGLGEPPIIPAAPAIANAIYDATGLRLRDLPLSRRSIVRALAAREENQ